MSVCVLGPRFDDRHILALWQTDDSCRLPIICEHRIPSLHRLYGDRKVADICGVLDENMAFSPHFSWPITHTERRKADKTFCLAWQCPTDTAMAQRVTLGVCCFHYIQGSPLKSSLQHQSHHITWSPTHMITELTCSLTPSLLHHQGGWQQQGVE